ncbi:MAG: 3-hydroxyacyl-ACP dehydratase [Chitinophagales bacterium]|nr:MAG: 3-hydroxyacyl-ACP dehydratase [Chitinophagales bacterium]
MLLNDFYKIETIAEGEPGRKFMASISFNTQHSIFSGHFPGMPVVPGVCLVKITGELISRHTGRYYRLLEADSIKFIRFVTPKEIKNLHFEITFVPEGNLLTVTGTAFLDQLIYFKLKGKYSEAPR